ncbi:MAG: LTA synthase family protein [Lawsonibacter sp.]|nr:LTA synthase family protein [Lawsonibacter sp.]
MGYNGRRMGSGQARRGRDTLTQTMVRVLLFPALLIYLELVLHICKKNALAYAPVYLIFSISAGLFFACFTLPWRRRTNGMTAKILAAVISLIYVIEFVAKTILQTYYGLSALKMAAGNRLTDYSEVIVSTVLRSIPIILILMLPSVLLCLFGGALLGFPRLDVRFAGLVMGGCVVFHILGLGMVHLPWKGDLTPAMLYKMDTNMDDQVEQLGMFTALRLDAKHMIFPPKNSMDADFSGIGGLPHAGSSASSSGDPVGSGSEPDPGPVIDTSPNVMDVDLAALAGSTSNQDVKWLAEYFSNVTPTNKNQYTGMFEGYNVIQIVIEGFSGYAIDPELTPTLYKLANEGFVFHNYYTALHFTSTSNGECQTLLGLYPKNGSPATMTRTGELGTNCYFSLAQQLGRKGYTVMGFHGNYEMYGRQKSHTNLGYDWRQFNSGLEVDTRDDGKIAWPARDTQVIENSVDQYINSDKPFHVYYLTISGHTPYSNNRVVAPYRDIVRALPYSETTQNYVATAMEADRSLKLLLDKLEAAGKLDKTLIVATGDHIPYADVQVLEELAGKQFGSSDALKSLNEKAIDFDVYKSALIMWSASMEEPVQVDKPCCQVDILPTVSNLLGLEYDSRMLDGSDILSDSEGLVVFTSRCWKTDKGFYDRFTGEFTPAEGVSMTPEAQESYVAGIKKLVGYKLDSTALLIENDFYRQVFG